MSFQTPLDVVTDLRRLLGFLGAHWRRRLLALAGMTVLGALAEVSVIGAVVPFLAIIADPDGVHGGRLGHLSRSIPQIFDLSLIHSLALIFIIVALLAAVVRLTLSRLTYTFVYAIGHEISVAIYSRIVHQPYSFHIARNSSESVAAINRVVDITHNMILPLVQAFSAAVIALFVVMGLFIIDPTVALVTTGAFGAIYALPSLYLRRRLLRNGAIIALMVAVRIKTVQEGVGGIRDVLIDHAQRIYIDKFSEVDREYHDRGRENVFMGAAPRFIVESLGLVLIAGLATALSSKTGGIYAALPVLGALAIGAQRLMPLFQMIYQSWAQIVSVRASFDAVMEFATLPLPSDLGNIERLPFARDLTMRGLSFRYQSGPPVLSDIDLTITRGTRVGFVGETGSGKTTLIDIIMGLLAPVTGSIEIDGVTLNAVSRDAWQENVAHVSQTIYLSDASIAENIAFGVAPDQIDQARLQHATGHAELTDFVASLPEGFATSVGERGIRLSGGQRQRIGIARALYKHCSILVLDEATSALDQRTEAAIMAKLQLLDVGLTILIIAHRLSTLEQCDVLHRLRDGRIVASGSFQQIVGRPEQLQAVTG